LELAATHDSFIKNAFETQLLDFTQDSAQVYTRLMGERKLAVKPMSIPVEKEFELVVSHIEKPRYMDIFDIQILHVDGMVYDLKYECKLDSSKPSAIPQKLFDVAKLNNIGWKVIARFDARESLIRKAGRPQKIKKNAI